MILNACSAFSRFVESGFTYLVIRNGNDRGLLLKRRILRGLQEWLRGVAVRVNTAREEVIDDDGSSIRDITGLIRRNLRLVLYGRYELALDELNRIRHS